MRVPPSSDEYFDPAGIKLIALINHWRRFIAVNVFIGMVIAAGLSLLIPNTYRSQASILPPKDQGSMLPRGAMDLMKGIGTAGLGGIEMPSSGSQQLVTVLRSRSLADIVIESEELVRHYDVDSLPNARRELKDKLSVTVDADGLVIITALDKEPAKAASVVTASLQALDSINQSISAGAASATRQFVDSRLREVGVQLRQAEDDLRTFQEQRGTIAIEEQLAVIIQNLAMLRVERMKYEMELASLVKQLGPDHKRLTSVRQKIRSLDAQIGAVAVSSDSTEELNAGNAPALTMSSVRLLRQVTVYDQLYQFLRQALEQAKIDERRDTPTFTVLDEAITPDRKWRPKRSFIVLGTGATIFVILALLIVWAEASRPSQNIPQVGYAAGWQRLAGRKSEPIA